MARDYRMICVHKIPRILTPDRMQDKLLIHFLRPRNGGGEVLEVVYPTEEAGVAFVTFELEEVAKRILGRNHLLELNNQKYPLEVRRAEDLRLKKSQDYMMINTTVNLQLFADKHAVKVLVEKYGFRICSETDLQVEIEGVLPALRKLRDELLHMVDVGSESLQPPRKTHRHPDTEQQKLLRPQEDVYARRHREVEVRPAPQGLEDYSAGNGYKGANGSQISSHSSEPHVSQSSRQGGPVSFPAYLQGNPVRGFSEYPPDGEHSSIFPKREFASRTLPQNLKDDKRPKSSSVEPYSPSSQGGIPYSSGVSRSPIAGVHPNSHLSTIVSDCITVDGDTLKYIQACRKREIDEILAPALVEMSTVDQGELSLVTFTSNSSSATSVVVENVSRKVLSLLSSTQILLRTQEIPLSMLSAEKQAMIIERSGTIQSTYRCVTVSHGDKLHLIGPSKEVFSLKQRLIELFSLDGSLDRGRTKEHLGRARVRRDSSCPSPRERGLSGASNYTGGDTRSYPAIQSAEKEAKIGTKIPQSSADTDTAKKERPRRASSAGRAQINDAPKSSAALSRAGQDSEPSKYTSEERGRERSRNPPKSKFNLLSNINLATKNIQDKWRSSK